MCFYNDFDWTASEQENRDEYAYRMSRCDDCGGVIGIFERFHAVHQWEHEICQRCEDDFADNYDEDHELDPCISHDYGEEYHGAFCLNCLLTRKAIHDHEIASGCPEHHSEPAWEQLFEELYQQPEYAKIAVDSYPELVDHLERL